MDKKEIILNSAFENKEFLIIIAELLAELTLNRRINNHAFYGVNRYDEDFIYNCVVYYQENKYLSYKQFKFLKKILWKYRKQIINYISNNKYLKNLLKNSIEVKV